VHRRIAAVAARLAALTAAWTVVVAVVLAPPAQSHDGVDVTVHTDGAGTVWATVAWTDGHPVAEPVSALMTATSAQGERVGPAALRAAPAAGTVAYPATLTVGEWLVSIDVALPAIGHCEATVVVPADGASPTPGQTRCPAPTPAAAPPVAAAPDGPGLAAVLAPIGVVALLIGAAVLWHRRPRHPGRNTPARPRPRAQASGRGRR
jgi:hypothetical protein